MESGKTTNLRRVSTALCEPSDPHPVDDELQVKHLQEASECHDAKENLLQAESDRDIDAAVRKVKVLCDH